MKSIIFGIILFIFFSGSIIAQGLFFGPQLGFSSTTILEKSAIGDVEKKMKFGYQVGVAADLELMSFLYVSGALNFSLKGDKMGDDTFKSKTKLGYIDFPINVGYKMPIGNISVYGSIGPYTAVVITGKSHYEMYDETGNVVEEFDHEIEVGGEYGYYKRYDTGISVSFGCEYKQYQIKLNYCRGFTDITNTEFVKSHNSALNITASYFFGRNY